MPPLLAYFIFFLNLLSFVGFFGDSHVMQLYAGLKYIHLPSVSSEVRFAFLKKLV